MRQVTYAGESFMTSDEVADVLLDLGAALANSGRALHVRVPTIGPHDEPIEIGMVLGPASQFTCRPVAGDHRIDGAEFVERAARAVEVLTGMVPAPTELVDAGDAGRI